MYKERDRGNGKQRTKRSKSKGFRVEGKKGSVQEVKIKAVRGKERRGGEEGYKSRPFHYSCPKPSVSSTAMVSLCSSASNDL